MQQEQKQRICQLLVRTARLEKGWSLEALGHGICSVSYLSKLEKGDALCSWEILELLMKRLEIDQPFGNEADLQNSAALLGLLREGRFEKAEAMLHDPACFSRNWLQSVEGQLYQLFFEICYGNLPKEQTAFPELEDHLDLLDAPQQAIWFLLHEQWQRAVLACPESWVSYSCASMIYSRQQSEFEILPLLENAYSSACEEGNIPMMALSSLVQGTVYSNMSNQSEALVMHKRTLRILDYWPNEDMLDDVHYNLAACLLEQGEFSQALDSIEKIKHPTSMAFHKKAVCYEQLGLKEQALAALEKAADPDTDRDGWDEALLRAVLNLVRDRLQMDDYVHNPVYGQHLMQVFEDLLQSEAHIGFSRFHLPWVIQWLKANRQYQKLASILEAFPQKPGFSLF